MCECAISRFSNKFTWAFFRPIRSFINSKMHYYHTVMGDVSDAEVLSAMELKLDDNHVQNQLSESMHVNYDQNTSTVLPEYGIYFEAFSTGHCPETRAARALLMISIWQSSRNSWLFTIDRLCNFLFDVESPQKLHWHRSDINFFPPLFEVWLRCQK